VCIVASVKARWQTARSSAERGSVVTVVTWMRAAIPYFVAYFILQEDNLKQNCHTQLLQLQLQHAKNRFGHKLKVSDNDSNIFLVLWNDIKTTLWYRYCKDTVKTRDIHNWLTSQTKIVFIHFDSHCNAHTSFDRMKCCLYFPQKIIFLKKHFHC
jgi:hypothetical protein